MFAIERTPTGSSTITGRSHTTSSIVAPDHETRLHVASFRAFGPRRLPGVRAAKTRDPGEDKLTLQNSFRWRSGARGEPVVHRSDRRRNRCLGTPRHVPQTGWSGAPARLGWR